MIPEVGDRATRVLCGLLYVDALVGRATFRSVALATGVGVGEVFYDLYFLRTLGLVDWDEGKSGTLRPLVDAFPVA